MLILMFCEYEKINTRFTVYTLTKGPYSDTTLKRIWMVLWVYKHLLESNLSHKSRSQETPGVGKSTRELKKANRVLLERSIGHRNTSKENISLLLRSHQMVNTEIKIDYISCSQKRWRTSIVAKNKTGGWLWFHHGILLPIQTKKAGNHWGHSGMT